ncbi:MAG: cyclic nucleotide-binding domain-containing protein [Candidatus Lambdaproteobacteria bacterium]|nr:cyclic nucleotide-binding domain-containing protein [Candidatus Lambdaproteobacteria bacterium]
MADLLRERTLLGHVMGRIKAGQMSPLVEFVATVPLFDGMTIRQLKRISGILHEREYSGGEYIFESGMPSAAMFFVYSGLVHLLMPNEHGEEVEFDRRGSGGFIGGSGMVDDAPRWFSAKVIEPTRAFALFRADLQELFEHDPEMGMKFYNQLARFLSWRLRETIPDSMATGSTSDIEAPSRG